MVIRRVIKSIPAGVDGEGRPLFTTEDRGWEADIAIYCGPGRGWDVNLLPDIITMSVMTNGVLEWETSTRGPLELPCTPDGWAVVPDVLTPNVVWATYQPPAVVAGPLDPPTLGAP